MNKKHIAHSGFGLLVVYAGTSVLALNAGLEASEAEKPNLVIIFLDDLGYADLGCFGSTLIRTPRIDRMAKEGMRFTNFYAQPICGPSRAALMTGCYPMRASERGNIKHVHPELHAREVTVAELLKSEGYATACFGKWDLAGHRQKGFHADLMPNHQGFDYFFGTPSSNDRVVDLYRNGKLIEEAADMDGLTRRYTDEALVFIRKNRDKPFFVYLAHTMPHTELGVSPEFQGKSPRGLYGDVIEEIDHSAGRILDTLSDLDVVGQTYVLLTSDNGPWLIKNKDYEDGRLPADHGGSAGLLRSGKVSTWEGGVRVPAVFWAPGQIPAGTVCDELASTLDVLPTFVRLAGARVPTDRVIDGEDITHLLTGKFYKANPDKFYCYYLLTELQALRQGKWKLHLPHPAGLPWLGPDAPNRHIAPNDRLDVREPMLFDLEADIGETTNVAGQHPEVVERLLHLAETVRQDVGDNDRTGKNMRFFDPPDKRPKTPLIKFRSEIGPPKR